MSPKLELDTGKARLLALRQAVAGLLLRARKVADLRALTCALRQSLRWAAFKVDMLGIARAEHLGEAREELEVVLAAVEHNRLALQQQLARRQRR